MVRRARVVVPNVGHHVMQRGNNQQDIFFSDDDRLAYLDILQEKCDLYGLEVHGYCLMPNHLHLVVVPLTEDALARAIGRTHFHYTQYVNEVHGHSGHFWQNRFFSCPLDDAHYFEAMRYVEGNPVHAKLVRRAWRWRWSSAAAHAGIVTGVHPVLDLDEWREVGITADEWRTELIEPLDDEMVTALRRATSTGRPLGSNSFISKLEADMGRRLRPLPHGRPRNDAKR